MTRRLVSMASAVLLACAWAVPAAAAGPVDCKLHYSLSGWSAFYKTASGSGTVTCDNGQTMAVKINAKGGGLTFGKTKISNGTGEFSGVSNIDEVLGTYAASEAHAGASKSADALAMTKGNVSLGLAGKGEGWELGVAFGKFVISR